MRFKTDENVPRIVNEILDGAGHDVVSVTDQGLTGLVDAGVAAVCRVENRVIVTLDLDFCDIRDFPPADYRGIIVFRPIVQTTAVIKRLTESVIALLDKEPLDKHLWIVRDTRVRIQPGLGVPFAPGVVP